MEQEELAEIPAWLAALVVAHQEQVLVALVTPHLSILLKEVMAEPEALLRLNMAVAEAVALQQLVQMELAQRAATAEMARRHLFLVVL